MNIIKRIKNVSGATQVWRGIELADNATYDIQIPEDHHWLSDSIVQTALTNSDAEMSDGTNTYTGQVGLSYLCSVRDDSNQFFIAESKTPSSATDIGQKGEICWDSGYFYICVAANTWKRTSLSTW